VAISLHQKLGCLSMFGCACYGHECSVTRIGMWLWWCCHWAKIDLTKYRCLFPVYTSAHCLDASSDVVEVWSSIFVRSIGVVILIHLHFLGTRRSTLPGLCVRTPMAQLSGSGDGSRVNPSPLNLSSPLGNRISECLSHLFCKSTEC